ncbi:MAG TPA: hypothetical protein VGR01_01090 [Burkholderiales bacterium]|nr:hypothetical protein [Burkholderiales bacterium]
MSIGIQTLREKNQERNAFNAKDAKVREGKQNKVTEESDGFGVEDIRTAWRP